MIKHNNKWLIVLGSAFITIAILGIVNNCFSIFIIPVTEELGILRSSYTAMQSISYLGIMTSAIFGFVLYERFGFMRVFRVAAFIAPFIYFTYSFAQTMFAFYIRAFIIGLCVGLSTVVPISLLIKSWFTESPGLALGVAFMASGLGSSILNKAVAVVIESKGWRAGYGFLGIAMLLLVLMALLFLRENPQNPIKSKRTGNSAERIQFKRLFPVLFCCVVTTMAGACLLYTINPYIRDCGYSMEFAATCASASLFTLSITKVLMGRLVDKKGLGIAFKVLYATEFCAMIAFAFFVHPALITIVMIGSAVGSCFTTVHCPMLPGILFDEDTAKRAVGWFNGACNLGLALSYVLESAIYDIFSSYRPVYLIMAAMTIVMVIMMRKIVKF